MRLCATIGPAHEVMLPAQYLRRWCADRNGRSYDYRASEGCRLSRDASDELKPGWARLERELNRLRIQPDRLSPLQTACVSRRER